MPTFIDEAFLQRLSNLRFIVKGRRKGHLAGLHASPRAGVSLEFADYRAYAPGDDFRYIDWNVYGRLDRLLVKTYVHEADLPIYLLIDFSASMQIGVPSKAHYAAHLAAAMAYLGLRGLDRVGLFPFTDRLIPGLPARHGMGQMGKILRLLRDIEPGERTSVNQAILEFLSRTRESGLTIVISDFLASGAEFADGLARLLHRGDEVILLQVLDPEDVKPHAAGTTRIVDVESSQRVTLTIGQRTLDEYAERIRRNREQLRTFSFERGIPCFQTTTDVPVERFLHEDLRNGGMLR
jgi:uncharacterized protein (DUF58 family)